MGTGHAYRFKMLADNLREREAELDETFKKLKSVSLFRDNLNDVKSCPTKTVYGRRFRKRKARRGKTGGLLEIIDGSRLVRLLRFIAQFG